MTEVTQIIIPTWLLILILVSFGLNAIAKIVEYFVIPKKQKIVLTYKEFKEFQDKTKFKEL